MTEGPFIFTEIPVENYSDRTGAEQEAINDQLLEGGVHRADI